MNARGKIIVAVAYVCMIVLFSLEAYVLGHVVLELPMAWTIGIGVLCIIAGTIGGAIGIRTVLKHRTPPR